MTKTLTPSEMATRKWDNTTPEQKEKHMKLLRRKTRAYWKSLSPAEQAKRIKKMVKGRKKRA